MAMTPKQVSGFLGLEQVRRKAEAAERLSLTALAAQGDGKSINKRISELKR